MSEFLTSKRRTTQSLFFGAPSCGPLRRIGALIISQVPALRVASTPPRWGRNRPLRPTKLHPTRLGSPTHPGWMSYRTLNRGRACKDTRALERCSLSTLRREVRVWHANTGILYRAPRNCSRS